MNQSFLSVAVVACVSGVFSNSTLGAQDEVSAGSPVSSSDSPIGFQFPFPSSEPLTQTHEPALLLEDSLPVSETPKAQTDQSLADAALPPLDPESIPLPRTDSSGASSPAGIGSKAAGAAWWNGPEAKVVGFLLVLIFGAWIVGRVSQRKGFPVKATGAARPSGVVQVLARFPLGRGTQLLLLECGQRILLLEQQRGKAMNGLQTLTEFTSREDVAELRRRLEASNRSSDESFQKDLEQSLGMYSRKGTSVQFAGTPIPDAEEMETVDLTRRRPRHMARGPE